jgi:hypothetical protein
MKDKNPLQEEALALGKEAVGERHFHTSLTHINLAITYARWGHLGAADLIEK